jgi:hypothetical protein
MLFLCASYFALACECGRNVAERPCSLLKTPSQLIFVGTLLSADNAPDPSRDDQTGQTRYTFRVDERFSQTNAKTIDVYSGRGCCDCSVRFEVNKHYLVEAHRDDNGLFFTSICTKTRLFKKSDPLLDELRIIRDGGRPDSLFGVLRKSQEPWGGAFNPNYDEPLAGRAIRLTSGSKIAEAKSNADGTFKFPELQAGEYTVSADLPPTLVLEQPILNLPLFPIRVAENACGEYNVNALPTGRIKGRVVNADGVGVDDAPLELFRVGRFKKDARGWDDRGWLMFRATNGYFEFNHVAPGDYILVLSIGPFGSLYAPAFYPSAPDLEHAGTIHVTEGGQVSDNVMHITRRTFLK